MGLITNKVILKCKGINFFTALQINHAMLENNLISINIRGNYYV
jgi:hypothetical protein